MANSVSPFLSALNFDQPEAQTLPVVPKNLVGKLHSNLGNNPLCYRHVILNRLYLTGSTYQMVKDFKMFKLLTVWKQIVSRGYKSRNTAACWKIIVRKRWVVQTQSRNPHDHNTKCFSQKVQDGGAAINMHTYLVWATSTSCNRALLCRREPEDLPRQWGPEW